MVSFLYLLLYVFIIKSLPLCSFYDIIKYIKLQKRGYRMSNNKIKFLFFTDTHYTFKAPSSRLEGNEYLNMLLEKTEEVFHIGKENNVDFYIHGGDFFDSPDIGDSVAGAVGNLYKNIQEQIYVVTGNHDLIGNNINTIFLIFNNYIFINFLNYFIKFITLIAFSINIHIIS